MWAIKVAVLISIQIQMLQSAVVCYSVIVHYVVLQTHWATYLTYGWHLGVTSGWHVSISVHIFMLACPPLCVSVCVAEFCNTSLCACPMTYRHKKKKKKFSSSLFYVDVAIWKSAISEQISGDMLKKIVSLKETFPLQSHRLTSIVTHDLKAPAALYVPHFLLFYFLFPCWWQINHAIIKWCLVYIGCTSNGHFFPLFLFGDIIKS